MLDYSSFEVVTPKASLHSTGTSFHRDLSREVRPSYANRIIRQHHDLHYQFEDKWQQIKSKNIRMKAQIKRNSLINKIAKEHNAHNTSPQQIYLKAKPLNPQSIDMPFQKSPYSLCPYIYALTTISGKLQKRSNHHLSFDKNKTARSININTVYYDNSQDIDGKSNLKIGGRRDAMKMHEFSSYTDRRVFQGKEGVDFCKLQPQRGRKIIKPNRIKQTIVPMQTVPCHPSGYMPISANLSYDITTSRSSSPSYTIPHSPRKFTITRQVINTARGCYR